MSRTARSPGERRVDPISVKEAQMALMVPPICPGLRKPALTLTIPDIGNSGPGHWQTLWETSRTDCRRVPLGRWDDPLPSIWVKRIDDAVWRQGGQIILAAHGLGCIAAAHWAERHGEAAAERVVGALLVAPSDVERPGAVAQFARFAPIPRTPLPFPSVVVGSTNDPYARIDRLRDLAAAWGSAFMDVGTHGHLNAASALGTWEFGQDLLEELQNGMFAARLRPEHYRSILRYGMRTAARLPH
jgi:predicted alpha/beta hydrolase family esterase